MKPSRVDDQFMVEVRFLPREEVKDECLRLGAWSTRPRGRQLVGCNMFYPDTKPKLCIIISEKPQWLDDDRTTTLGHELLHCARGTYH